MHEDIDILRFKLAAAQRKHHDISQELLGTKVKIEQLDAELIPLKNKLIYDSDNFTPRGRQKMEDLLDAKKNEVTEVVSKRCRLRYQERAVERAIESLQSQIKASARAQGLDKILDEHSEIIKQPQLGFATNNEQDALLKVIRENKAYKIAAIAMPQEIASVDFESQYVSPPESLLSVLRMSWVTEEEE